MSAAKKTERLLNLVICLLASRRYLGVQEIRRAVPGYEQGSEEAFRRMFERDKEELRELGVPLETGSDTTAHNDELGYRIARRDYELPPISLEPDEAAALGLAARLWQSGLLAGATGSALLKLRAAGIDPPESTGALEPRVGAREPAFAMCLAAVRDGRLVHFGYRSAGRAAAEDRTVEPWGVVSWHGRWYLAGHDAAREDTRVFRLSRVVGEVTVSGEKGAVEVPDGVDLRALVGRMAAEPPHTVAHVSVRPGAGWALRREAGASAPLPATTAAAAATATDDRQPAGTTEPPSRYAGWDTLQIGYTDPERLADRVVGFGRDVVVLSPPEARDAVVRRLESSAGGEG